MRTVRANHEYIIWTMDDLFLIMTLKIEIDFVRGKINYSRKKLRLNNVMHPPHAEQQLNADEVQIGCIGKKQKEVDMGVDGAKQIYNPLVDTPLLLPVSLVHVLKQQRGRSFLECAGPSQLDNVPHRNRSRQDPVVQNLKLFLDGHADGAEKDVQVSARKFTNKRGGERNEGQRLAVGDQGEQFGETLVEVGMHAAGEAPTFGCLAIVSQPLQGVRDDAEHKKDHHHPP